MPHTWGVAALFIIGVIFHYPQQILGTDSPSLLSFLGLSHQAVERMFFLIPVTWAGMVFGLRTGFACLGLTLAIIIPRIFMTDDLRGEAIFETGAVFILGVLLNTWFETKRKESVRYRDLIDRIEESDRRISISEMKYRYLFEHASDAMWLQDIQGRFLDGNAAFEKLTGFTVKEMVGVHLRPFLSDESLARAREIRRHLVKGEAFEQPYEQIFYVKGGGTKPVQMSTNALVVDDEFIGFEHVARDMTREKEFEENVRAYIQQITMAQEDERKRVSRDLHDDVSPEILVLIKKLDALYDRGRLKVSEVRDSIGEVRSQAEKALEALRRTAQGLRPRIIDDLGLVAAVEWIAEELEREEDITIQVTSSGIDREPSPEVQIVLFRITQEALNNIRKHASAGIVEISLRGTEDTIHLEITDNGKGFTVPVHVEDTVRDGHLGLMGMDERARLLNGTLEISSVPGKGTRILARLPWSVGS